MEASELMAQSLHLVLTHDEGQKHEGVRVKPLVGLGLGDRQAKAGGLEAGNV